MRYSTARLVATVAVLVVAAGIILGFFIWYFLVRYESSEYSIVQLMGGTTYIGKLTTFPTWQLRDVYSLQVTQGEPQAQQNIQLLPLSEVVWSPKVLNINPDQVIFSAPLRDDSSAVSGIKTRNR